MSLPDDSLDLMVLDRNQIGSGQYPASNLGIFIAGFSRSGSSAVVDWLRGNSSIVLPELEEIHSLNHGLSNLLKVVDHNSGNLEWLARKMLCPNIDLWSDVFGKRLSEHDSQYWLSGFIKENLFVLLVKLRAQDVISGVTDRLNLQLGRDYSTDKEYLEAVKRLIHALRKTKENESLYDSLLLKEISSLFAVFYSRWSVDGKLLLFNNAFTGRRAKYFDLIDNSFFTDQIIIFVYSDPRDQFVRKIVGSPFHERGARSFNRFMLNQFINEYRNNMDEVQTLIYKSELIPYKQIMLVSFEDFVLNISETRGMLTELFGKKLEDNGFVTSWNDKYFKPEESKKNIGIWKDAGFDREMQKISKKLPEFLHLAAN